MSAKAVQRLHVFVLIFLYVLLLLMAWVLVELMESKDTLPPTPASHHERRLRA